METVSEVRKGGGEGKRVELDGDFGGECAD